MKPIKQGTKISLSNGSTAIVKSLLGEGGQGAVYLASVEGKDYALKMATSDDNMKASYDRKIKTTIIAGVSALITTQFVGWILGYFK